MVKLLLVSVLICFTAPFCLHVATCKRPNGNNTLNCVLIYIPFFFIFCIYCWGVNCSITILLKLDPLELVVCVFHRNWEILDRLIYLFLWFLTHGEFFNKRTVLLKMKRYAPILFVSHVQLQRMQRLADYRGSESHFVS